MCACASIQVTCLSACSYLLTLLCYYQRANGVSESISLHCPGLDWLRFRPFTRVSSPLHPRTYAMPSHGTSKLCQTTKEDILTIPTDV